MGRWAMPQAFLSARRNLGEGFERPAERELEPEG